MSNQAEDTLKRVEELFEQPRQSFERAKLWSDYLAFHIRFLVFVTLAIVCSALFAERVAGWPDHDLFYRATLVSLLLSASAFSAFAFYMVVCIAMLNYDFFASKLVYFFINRLMNEKGSAIWLSQIAAMILVLLVLLGFGAVVLTLIEIARLETVA
ncbi:hypothetical protein [Gymnodinialimonas ulvae]|uniref:hypothetical protein n=1 Tax=Gymnodinialimonas ulvae TaxID=3126504 RepID=UPI0030A2EB82